MGQARHTLPMRLVMEAEKHTQKEIGVKKIILNHQDVNHQEHQNTKSLKRPETGTSTFVFLVVNHPCCINDTRDDHHGRPWPYFVLFFVFWVVHSLHHKIARQSFATFQRLGLVAITLRWISSNCSRVPLPLMRTV